MAGENNETLIDLRIHPTAKVDDAERSSVAPESENENKNESGDVKIQRALPDSNKFIDVMVISG